VILNFGRALFLTWTAASSGVETVNRWHDPAGYAVFAGACLLLWGMAVFLRSRDAKKAAPTRGEEGPPTEENVPSASAHKGVWWVGCFPKGAGIFFAAWLLVVESGTEFWYRSHESARSKSLAWSLQWPEFKRDFEFQDIPEEVKLILRYNRGRSGLWSRPDGSEWFIYEFEWLPGRAAAQLARSHRPEVCLPASGLTLVSEMETLHVPVHGIDLPFTTYVFEQNGTPLYVFFCLWEQRGEEESGNPEGFTRQSRLRAVLDGRRHTGQQLLEIAVSGVSDQQRARADVQKYLQGAVQIRSARNS
jgi:hypothetical protein